MRSSVQVPRVDPRCSRSDLRSVAPKRKDADSMPESAGSVWKTPRGRGNVRNFPRMRAPASRRPVRVPLNGTFAVLKPTTRTRTRTLCYRHLSAHYLSILFGAKLSIMSLRPSSQRVLSLLNTYSASHTQAACSTRTFVTCLHPDGLRRRTSLEKPLSRSWAAQRVRLTSV